MRGRCAWSGLSVMAWRLRVGCLLGVMTILVDGASIWFRLSTANRGSIQQPGGPPQQSQQPTLTANWSNDSPQSPLASNPLFPCASAHQVSIGSRIVAHSIYLPLPLPLTPTPIWPFDALRCSEGSYRDRLATVRATCAGMVENYPPRFTPNDKDQR